jgi:hypothetical protein
MPLRFSLDWALERLDLGFDECILCHEWCLRYCNVDLAYPFSYVALTTFRLQV